VAEKVLKQGECPVLLLRSKAAGNTNEKNKAASALGSSAS
jgi:hypothetical protein